MKTETREIYKCDHCRKMYQRKNACEYHERFCGKNPSVLRPCHDCQFLSKRNVEIWAGYGDPYGEATRHVDILYCSKKDAFIHTPKVAAKGNAFEIGDKENIEMPTQCDLHKSRDYSYNPNPLENTEF